jgi:hypothetical protein
MYPYNSFKKKTESKLTVLNLVFEVLLMFGLVKKLDSCKGYM